MEPGFGVSGAKVQTIFFFETPNKYSSRGEMLCSQYFRNIFTKNRK